MRGGRRRSRSDQLPAGELRSEPQIFTGNSKQTDLTVWFHHSFGVRVSAERQRDDLLVQLSGLGRRRLALLERASGHRLDDGGWTSAALRADGHNAGAGENDSISTLPTSRKR